MIILEANKEKDFNKSKFNKVHTFLLSKGAKIEEEDDFDTDIEYTYSIEKLKPTLEELKKELNSKFPDLGEIEVDNDSEGEEVGSLGDDWQQPDIMEISFNKGEKKGPQLNE